MIEQKKLEAIEFNTFEVIQSELNIDNKERSNLFSWNGQFSPQFIETLLNKYSNNQDDVIYDPFSGSGTVLYESGRKGLKAIGIELNPSAYYMSKFYELISLNLEERKKIIFYIDGIINNVYFEEEYKILFSKEHLENANNKIVDTIKLLIILLDIDNKLVNAEILNKKWFKLKNDLLSLPYSQNSIESFLGDSRFTKIPSDVCSLVITSPPYINVFNYHQNYRKSVEKLGYDVLNIAKSELGANRKHRGNRFYTVVQYCIDMALSIRETIRIAKEGAQMIYIVGKESRVLGLDFYNSRLIYNIFTQIYKMDLRIKQSRSFKNRFGKLITEDILHFVNDKKEFSQLEETEIIRIAQEIGKNELMLNLNKNIEEKNLLLLHEAINNYLTIRRSEFNVG